MDLLSTYNRIAQDWHIDHQSDDWWITGANEFSRLLPPGGTVLDAGCAGGLKSAYFLKKGFQVTGIDFAEKFIEIAKKEVPKGEFLVADIYNLSSFHKTFDGIFLQAVLLHIPKNDVAAVLNQLLQKLKMGGYIYISVKVPRPEQSEEERIVESDYGYEYERFFSFFTEDELRVILQEHGLEIVSLDIHQGKTSWIQVIGKKK